MSLQVECVVTLEADPNLAFARRVAAEPPFPNLPDCEAGQSAQQPWGRPLSAHLGAHQCTGTPLPDVPAHCLPASECGLESLLNSL